MLFGTALLATSLIAGAHEAALDAPASAEVAPKKAEHVAWSTDLLDTAGLTRFHLVGRGTFSDGASAFSSATAFGLEARAHLQVADGVALAAVLPLGLTSGRDGGGEVFLGNLGLGVSLGGTLSQRPGFVLKLGGGFDAYLPTAGEPKDDTAGVARSTVAAIRAYEPQLYVPRMLSGRLRGLAELTAGAIDVQLEAGLVPGVTLLAQKDFELLLAVGGRVSASLSDAVEPFLEAGCAKQLGGAGDIAPPFLVTPGVRLHLGEVFDPAVFVSFNFVESSAVVFGLDLASAIRPSPGASRAKTKERDGFLDDF